MRRYDHFDERGYLRCRICGQYKPPECFYYSKLEKYRNYKAPECKQCMSERKKRYRKNVPVRSDIEKHLAILLNGCKSRIKHSSSIKRRNLQFDLDYKFLYELYKKQEGKCAISGLPMTYNVGHGRNYHNISIDRIDSTKGYTKDNVQLVCAQVNMMKSDMTMEMFYNFCENILKNKSSNGKNKNNTV